MTLVKVLITQAAQDGLGQGSPIGVSFMPTRERVIVGTPDEIVLPFRSTSSWTLTAPPTCTRSRAPRL